MPLEQFTNLDESFDEEPGQSPEFIRQDQKIGQDQKANSLNQAPSSGMQSSILKKVSLMS